MDEATYHGKETTQASCPDANNGRDKQLPGCKGRQRRQGSGDTIPEFCFQCGVVERQESGRDPANGTPEIIILFILLWNKDEGEYWAVKLIYFRVKCEENRIYKPGGRMHW